MNEIFLCIECGRIGSHNDLAFYEINVPDNEIMNKIVTINKLGSFKCPACGSSKILHSKPISIVPSVVPFTTISSKATLLNLENTAPIDPAGILQAPVEELKPRPIVRFTNECDTCRKEFNSKVNGATRCPECIKKLIK